MSNSAHSTHLDAVGFEQAQMDHYRRKQQRPQEQRTNTSDSGRRSDVKSQDHRPQPLRTTTPTSERRSTPKFQPLTPPSAYAYSPALAPFPAHLTPPPLRTVHDRTSMESVATTSSGRSMRTIHRSASGRFRLPCEEDRPPVPPKDHILPYQKTGSYESFYSPRQSATSSRPSINSPRGSIGSRTSMEPPPSPLKKPTESSRASIRSRSSSKTRDSHPKRPGSSSSSIFTRPFSRSNSTTRETQNHPQSPPPSRRKGSFKETLRRASNELQKDLTILRMTPKDRQKFLLAEKLRMDEEIESLRQADPHSRPQYQREYNLHHTGDEEAVMDDTARYLAQDFAIQQKNDTARYEALAERYKSPPMKTGERAAIFLSKGMDVFRKEERKDSVGSEDSDGMDFADIGAGDDIDDEMEVVLEACQRCGKPTREWLVKGFCRECHQLRVSEFWDADSTPTPGEELTSFYGSDSSSPDNPRPVDEEEYMKTTLDRRIRRVRQTVYEDPGNPFNIEEEEDDEPFEEEKEKEPPFISIKRNLSLSSSHIQLHAPTPIRTGTPVLIRQHKYSDSAPLPQQAEKDSEGYYIPPRSFWAREGRRGKSLPANVLRDKERRDTKFYAFWEGVLGEYAEEEGEGGVEGGMI